MTNNRYHFVTHWRIQATLDEVAAIIGDAEALPRWWPAVYLDVQQVADGDAAGVGKQVTLFTKGWLPYTLRWNFVVTEATPTSFTLVADGDFVGRGIWTFVPDGGWTTIIYDWQIDANKPLLRYLSFMLKPLFRLNHEWAMRQGEISLAREVRRRHAPDDTTIPAPPQATPSALLPWLAFALTRPRSWRGL